MIEIYYYSNKKNIVAWYLCMLLFFGNKVTPDIFKISNEY